MTASNDCGAEPGAWCAGPLPGCPCRAAVERLADPSHAIVTDGSREAEAFVMRARIKAVSCLEVK